MEVNIMNIKKSTRKLTILGLCFLLISLLVLLNGCNARVRNPGPEISPDVQRQDLQGDNLPGVEPQQIKTRNAPLNLSFNRQKADNIRNQLEDMKEVKNADVIVIGNTALIGYEPAGDLKGINTSSKKVNAANNMIRDKVTKTDKSITNVAVTREAEIVIRIKKLSSDITNNMQDNDIKNDFNQIIRGINPAS